MERPADFPRLTDYKPSRFMLPTSHYDEAKADRAVRFIEMLPHTKGEWEGKPFWLLPWQEELVRNLFGVVKEDGTRQFKTAFVEIPKKNGKQLAVDTPIPTPSGFISMGELKIGDTVFDEHGKPCRVINKSEVDTEETAYRIVWRDGSEIIAGARHQWCVESIYGKARECVMTSEEIYHRQKATHDHYGDIPDGLQSCIRIPVASALQTEDVVLPVDPYTYGFWLGDGVSNKPYLTIFDEDVNAVLAAIPYQHTTFYKNGEGRSMCYRFEELTKILVENHRQKVIPRKYLRASEKQRWNLLAGLMDSDGHVSKTKGQSVYISTNKNLADGVRELLWSLGIKNAMTETPSEYHGSLTGETLYTIRFVSFDDMPVSKLNRYLIRRRPRKGKTRNCYHYIRSIESIGNGIPMQCIQVDSPSHCYLAGKSMIPTHNSELAAAIALYMLYADGEPSAEVYGAACDRQQASLVYDISKRMIEMTPALLKRSKILGATKRIINYSNSGIYQVLSADVSSKHGANISACVIDEVHVVRRALVDVLTKGSSDARRNPLHFLITTAGDNRESVAYELHQKSLDILAGKREDPTFYPVIYSLDMDEDWRDEKNWYRVNPSLGYTIRIDGMREAFHEAEQNPADEVTFRWLRLNQWVGSTVAWIADSIVGKGQKRFNDSDLIGRECYAGLDLSSSEDITAFALLFPPRHDSEKFILKLFCWVPEDTVARREKQTGLPYKTWVAKKNLETTPGNVIDYAYIQKKIEELSKVYNIREIAYDRWGSNMLVERLVESGLTIVPMGQGFKDMTAPTRRLYEELMKENILYDNPIFRHQCSNVNIDTDPAGNQKITKKRAKGKVDAVVATVMALDRCVRHEQSAEVSVYDTRGLLSF